MENTNIAKIIGYFESGCKESFQLGLELEHIVVDKNTKKSVDYFGDKGIEQILNLLKSEFDEAVMSNNHLIGLSNSDYSISLEPAGQFEISIKKQSDIKNIEQIYQEFLNLTNPILDKMNYELLNIGYHPVSRIDELSMLPKDRYKYMYQHFSSSGQCGKNMMKGTAATQISIDYINENDFINKYRAAMLLGPILAILTDNAPVFEGTIYEKNMLRQYIWKNVDPERTDFRFDLQSFGFIDYANFVYNTSQVIQIEGNRISYTDKSAKELYKDKELSDEDLDVVLSMVFPDVRLKKYIEIRVADSLPFQYVLSYLALIKGLFIDSKDLDLFIKELHYRDHMDIEAAKNSLNQDGFFAKVYGFDVKVILDKMLGLAKQKLEPHERAYLDAFVDLIRGGKTLSQIQKEKE